MCIRDSLQTYVNNLNKQIEGTEFANMELVDIVKKSEGGIFNNAGQTLNHNLYFLQFSPKGSSKPSAELLKAIEEKWGSLEEFKKAFEADAAYLFGAGWAWLSADKSGKLSIGKYTNAGNPVVDDLTPLLCADVWEHAYYVDYENRRPEHDVYKRQILSRYLNITEAAISFLLIRLPIFISLAMSR